MKRKNIAAWAVIPMIMLSGCANNSPEYTVEDVAPTVTFMPVTAGFDEELLPEGWTQSDGLATNEKCSMQTNSDIIAQAGMAVGDTVVTHAYFVNRYAYILDPSTSVPGNVNVNSALGEEMEFLTYDFTGEKITFDTTSEDEENPDMTKEDVHFFVALRGLDQNIEYSDGKIGAPVMVVEGDCSDPDAFDLTEMQQVASAAVFEQGQQ